MKAFLSIKYHADHANRARIEAISAALAACGIETFCVVRDLERWGAAQFAPAELMRRTFAAIAASDLVVIDLTEKGVGVGIEAGYARAKQIPLVTIARAGADISATLVGISRQVFFYTAPSDLEKFFRAQTLDDELGFCK